MVGKVFGPFLGGGGYETVGEPLGTDGSGSAEGPFSRRGGLYRLTKRNVTQGGCTKNQNGLCLVHLGTSAVPRGTRLARAHCTTHSWCPSTRRKCDWLTRLADVYAELVQGRCHAGGGAGPNPPQPSTSGALVGGLGRTRKRHPQGHRPQRPSERSDPTQHAKGRTGDCPGPRKGATTRRNVAQGVGVSQGESPSRPPI